MDKKLDTMNEIARSKIDDQTAHAVSVKGGHNLQSWCTRGALHRAWCVTTVFGGVGWGGVGWWRGWWDGVGVVVGLVLTCRKE